MDKLPKEIVIKAFAILDINSKLKCILVCKKWYKIITKNILYNKLTFKNTNDFNDAIDLFCNKREFGLLVEDLTIKRCEIEIFSILIMPTQLPNVKIFNWSEVRRTIEEQETKDISIKELPSKKVYQRQLKNWNKIVRLTINIERLSFATMLLESSLLVYLLYLNIDLEPFLKDSYFYQPYMIKVRSIIKKLIKNIKSASSLEELSLNFPVLDLDDMENLHASSPNLKSIKLTHAAITGGNVVSRNGDYIFKTSGLPIGQIPANNVKKLYITFFLHTLHTSAHDLTVVKKEAMVKWLTYIGCKYNNINNLTLRGLELLYLPKIQEFEQPILTIISKMQELSLYHAFIYPITRSVMDAIDNNNGNLKHLYIYSDDLAEIETQLDHVNLSRQSKSIFDLNFGAEGLDIKAEPTFSTIVFGLSQHFHCLTDLAIKSNLYYDALVEILCYLPKLHNLKVYIIIDEDFEIVHITKCEINILHITLSWDNEENIVFQANEVIEFMLQSCPLLSKFTLKGDLEICSKGIIRLCFFYHENLKTIKMDIKGIQYYTFPWVNGKQGIKWADYNKPLEIHDEAERKLRADISWRSEQAIVIDLKKAPVKYNY